MNEISSILRVVNTALKTIKVMELFKKVVIITAVCCCGFFSLKYWKKNKIPKKKI